MDDFSVLQARDPSFTGWSRPKPGFSLVKNLRSIFEAEASSGSPSNQSLKVYLRLKPCLCNDGDGGPSTTSFTILDEHTLSTFAPRESVTFKNLGSSFTHQFKFTKIFGPESCQKEVFDECVSESVKDFVTGNNSLIFAYGTTNAGKTYTVQGTRSQPGLVPRALDFLFKRINGKEAHVGRFKPQKVDEIIELDDLSIAKDARYKQTILQWDWEHNTDTTRDGDDLSSSNSSDFVLNAFREMQKTISEETPGLEDHKEGDVVFSVWVSYAEIYNDYIYDLLEPVQSAGTRRVPLKLGMDSDGNVYIKDLRHIHVASGDEAFQVMLYGKTHLQVAATKMNARSSRSHSVFTVKLVRYVNTEESPTHARVSNFSFCDLAGAERVKKTLNVGDRLKESSNINTSLHVLGRCLTTIKENQGSKYKKQIPFRESKLTRLFQRALQGHESVTMLVNVNLSTILYDETIHVLKFSAIANQIVLQTPIKRTRRPENKRSRFSSLALRPSKSICWENLSDEEVGSGRSSVVDDLSAQNEALMEKLVKLHEELREEKRKNLSLERDIRISLTEQFTKMMEKSDKQWKERLRVAEESNEEYSSWRINELKEYYEHLLHKKRKRMSLEGRNESNELAEFEEAELKESLEDAKETVKELEEALALEKRSAESLKAALKELRQERDNLLTQNSQLKFSLAHTENVAKNNENLLQASSGPATDELVQELQKQLAEEREAVVIRNKQIESMKALLNEARDDIVMLNKEKEEAEDVNDSFEQQIAEKSELVKDLSCKVEELESLVTQLTETISTFEQKEMASSGPATDELVQKLQKQLEEERDAAVIKDELFESTKALLNEAREDIVKLSKEKEEAENNNVNFEQQIAEKNALVKDLSCKVEELESLVTQLTETKSSLEQNEMSTKALLNEAREDIVKLNQEKEEAENNIVNFERQIAEKNELIKDLSGKVEELESVVTQLTETVSSLEQKEMASRGPATDELVQELQKQLAEEREAALVRSKRIESEAEEKHEAELKALQKDLKKSLQKNVQLEETIRKLEESVRKSHEESARMEQEVKNALHHSQIAQETRTSTAELVKLLSNAKEEADQHKAEMQKLLEDKKALESAFSELEKEFESFKSNRDVVVNKYENLLKNCKEDSERDKKEIAALRATLFKNPSTPNQKQYEAEIYKLKEQLELLQLQNQVLKEKNVENRSDNCIRPGVNDDVTASKKRTTKKSTACTKTSVKGSTEDINRPSTDLLEPPKSARRTRRKDTVDSEESCMLPPPATPTVDECPHSRRTNRNRKLFAPPSSDNYDGGENLEPSVLQAEPVTPEVFTKNLRSRSRRM